jgi:adenylate cyclase class 2
MAGVTMATEIELKAHVLDSETLKVLLCEKAEYSGAFEKEDTYWFGTSGMPLSRLRVRKEKRSLPDGSGESATFATYKNKEVKDGIEINDELEFEVNPGPEFEEFLSKMGFKPGISKRKRGWAFSHEGITAELTEVEGLGWFVELEILANGIYADGIYTDGIDTGNREEAVTEGRKKLLDFLAELGIEKEAIESRFYTEMLKELYSK